MTIPELKNLYNTDQKLLQMKAEQQTTKPKFDEVVDNFLSDNALKNAQHFFVFSIKNPDAEALEYAKQLVLAGKKYVAAIKQ